MLTRQGFGGGDGGGGGFGGGVRFVSYLRRQLLTITRTAAEAASNLCFPPRSSVARESQTRAPCIHIILYSFYHCLKQGYLRGHYLATQSMTRSIMGGALSGSTFTLVSGI